MSSFGKDLIAAMEEAAAHAQGKGPAARIHTIEVPDVRAIREGWAFHNKLSPAPTAIRWRRS